MFSKKKKQDNDEQEMHNNHQEQAAEQTEAADAGQNDAAEPIEELSAEQKLQLENKELNDKFLRLFAEFDNYKKRTQKERVDLLQTAGKDIIVSLLPVLDDFERALKATETATDVESVREGVVLIQNKLNGILSAKGLKPIESIHQAFDTDFHEAITNVPAPSEDLKGKVMDEVERGYTLNDKVVRYAKVVVGN